MSAAMRASKLLPLQSDLFKRTPRRWESRHAASLRLLVVKNAESVEQTLKANWSWQETEPVVTVLARFRPDTNKVQSTEWKVTCSGEHNVS